MSDVLLESVRAFVLFGIVLYLVFVGRTRLPGTSRGWNWIVGGFLLLFFGSAVDITDNFETLNRFVVIGDTEAQAFLEKFVGFLGGFIVLAIGLVLWIPRELEDRQRAEEALRDSEERLKNQVADLRDREERLETQSADLVDYAENLAAARDELQQLNDQKDKFFSIIAHDLRGPFNALLGYSDLLSSGIAGADQDKVAEYGNAVHQSAQSVFKLLKNLLEWSRLQMGRLDIELAPMDLGHVIDTNLKLFEPIAKKKAIRLIGNTSQPLEAFADAHTIDTVVRNLVNNAIKFTPAKGSVTIDAARNGDWPEIEVSDTGVGISADRVARLFRLDEKTSTVGTFGETGTGLGLHLCKELVERQGGRIAVESTEGEGSVFRLSLPLHHR